MNNEYAFGIDEERFGALPDTGLKRGLKVMDSTAISLCRDNSLPIVIFNLNKPGNIRRVVTGEKVGSLVMA